MTVGIFYVGLLLMGVVYAAIAGAMGWLADLGGGDVHVDASGHLDAGHPHPVSGTTVATFLTGFGGAGTVCHYVLNWPVLRGAAAATVSGLALAAAAYFVLELIFTQTQAGSEFSSDELIGREAEVISSLPEGGMGEVSYTIRGQREKAAARSIDGAAVPRGGVVVIDKVVGATVYVRPKD